MYDIGYDLDIVSRESEWQASSSTVFIMKSDSTFVTSNDESKSKPAKSTAKENKPTSLDELTPSWKPVADLCKRYGIIPKLHSNQTVTGGECNIPEEIFGKRISIVFNYFYNAKANTYFSKDHVCCTIWIGYNDIRLSSSQLTNVNDLISKMLFNNMCNCMIRL